MKLARLLVDVAAVILLTCQCTSQGEKTCEALDRKCFDVAAFVPARAGSKGIKDKNLSILGNETLLERTLRIIKECGEFDSIWVSTDGKNIADVANAQGAKVHWRNPKTATDNASTISAVEDFLLTNAEIRVVAVIQCTSPFIQSEFLSKALDYIKESDVDCVFSATRSHQLRWIENEDGSLSPINFKTEQRPRRQDWNGELVENGMFYFAKTQLILKDKTFQNKRCRIVEVSKRYSLEIDTKFDLALARMMLSIPEEPIQ